MRRPDPVLQNAYCAVHAATNFNPQIKRILYGHKFHNRLDHVPLLAGLLKQYWDSLPPQFGFKVVHPENVLVVPIPPHAGEPSLIENFALQFAKHFGYDYRPDLLSWRREIKPQHRIHDKQQRLNNIHKSMHLKSGIVSGYEKVIIIDDMMTTGATLLEASRAFRSESADAAEIVARKLFSLVVTRVPLGAQIRSAEVE